MAVSGVAPASGSSPALPTLSKRRNQDEVHMSKSSKTKDRPIIFNAEMVRAILDGRKTQTRRIIKLDHERGMQNPVVRGKKGEVSYVGCRLASSLCPFGQPGDRLWVRETFRVMGRATDVARLMYKASECNSFTESTRTVPIDQCNKQSSYNWTPSIHMPRWASRITLEITGARVERLQDISDVEAMREGIQNLTTASHAGFGIPGVVNAQHPTRAFQLLWESIYGADSWQANPWVWVVEFKVIDDE